MFNVIEYTAVLLKNIVLWKKSYNFNFYIQRHSLQNIVHSHSFNSIRIDRQTDIFYNWFMIQESQTLNSNPLQICKDNPNNITYFESFKLIARITGRTSTAYNTNDVEIVAPSKYLNNFWRTLKMLWLIVRFILSMNCVIINSTGVGTFAITDTKLFLSVVTKFTQDNTKQLQQLKLGFKRTINWNKYQLKVLVQAQNHYLYYCLIWDFKELTDFLFYWLMIMKSEQNIQDT